MRSAMAVPMRLGDETLGAITFVAADSGRTFDDDDLAFAQDLALRAATAVQNARLYAEQERVAHTLQASLLPERLPELPGWDDRTPPTRRASAAPTSAATSTTSCRSTRAISSCSATSPARASRRPR